ncbi:MAG: SRPBCC family protein [Rhizobiales bacterium]|nr:SRPBCC family protein [Hyphomicrobiales bacterium]NRB13627.1 SRPBCC family protein [Hyphomicrobiales bacterium]
MPKFSVEKIVNAPKATVWTLLADFENIDFFNDAINKSYLTEGSDNGGLGATRHCDLSDGKNYLKERVLKWDEGEGMTIDIYATSMPIKSNIVRFELEQFGDKTKARMIFDYELKFGILGKIMSKLGLTAFMRKQTNLVLDGLAQKAEAAHKQANLHVVSAA